MSDCRKKKAKAAAHVVRKSKRQEAIDAARARGEAINYAEWQDGDEEDDQ